MVLYAKDEFQICTITVLLDEPNSCYQLHHRGPVLRIGTPFTRNNLHINRQRALPSLTPHSVTIYGWEYARPRRRRNENEKYYEINERFSDEIPYRSIASALLLYFLYCGTSNIRFLPVISCFPLRACTSSVILHLTRSPKICLTLSRSVLLLFLQWLN